MTLKLYDFAVSGHCHRVRLFLSLLDLPHTIVPVDLLVGAHKKPDFLRLNRFGQVPVLEDGEIAIADSNAILVYLAERYAPESWYPRTPVEKAAIQRWLSIAAGPLAFYPAVARRTNMLKLPLDDALIAQSHNLFKVIEAALEKTPFLAGTNATIADLAIYSYTAVASEGNVSLDDYPNIRAWLGRIEALPRFVPMPRLPIGLNA